MRNNSNIRNNTSLQMVSKLDNFDRILQEGLAIMEEILEEEKRYHKVAEKQLGNIVTGLAAIGKIMNAGFRNMSGVAGGSSNPTTSLTNSMFDKLARGM